MNSRMHLAVRVWPWVLALLMLYPVLAPGYVLSYDMVFVPDLALRSDFLGLGSGLPRAVPSDALVSVVDEVVPGMVLQKVILLGTVVLAGHGARRLVPAYSGVAQLAATSLYVWNPYVVERLVIGHWPLLVAYAALPWVVDAARRLRAGERTGAALVLWLAAAALSASGGVMAGIAAVAFTAGRSRAALRRTGLVVGAVVAVNAPWLAAGLVHASSGLTDPAGVEAFAAGGEGRLPMPLAILSLGGIWNLDVVPVSRLGTAGVVWLVLVVAVCSVGLRAWLRWLSRRDVVGFVACGAVAVLVAVVGALLPDAMAWVVGHVPGGGLLRDGARFLGLLALVEASLFGMGASVLSGVMRERVGNVALAGGAVLLPLALMPDAAAGAAGRLDPVDFPREYAEARQELARAAAGPGHGDALILPFSSYRAPSWNDRHKTLDPLGRYLTPNYVASDDLFVSGERIAGEDPRARRIARALRNSSGEDLRQALAREGVSWVVLDREAQRSLHGLVPRVSTGPLPVLASSRLVTVWRVPDAGRRETVGEAGRVLVGLGWALACAAVLSALAVLVGRARTGRANSPRNM